VPFEVEWEGQKYRLSESGFYNARTFLKPPEAVQQHLKSSYARQLEHALEDELNPAILMKYSGIAEMLNYLDLAHKLVERIFVFQPRNGRAVARASSILREKGQPEKALAVTNRIPEDQQDHVVLTTRAAALCDLERWYEADKVIRRALARLRGRPKIEATEAWSVYNRIPRHISARWPD